MANLNFRLKNTSVIKKLPNQLLLQPPLPCQSLHQVQQQSLQNRLRPQRPHQQIPEPRLQSRPQFPIYPKPLPRLLRLIQEIHQENLRILDRIETMVEETQIGNTMITTQNPCTTINSPTFTWVMPTKNPYTLHSAMVISFRKKTRL